LAPARIPSIRQLKYLSRILSAREYRAIKILGIVACINIAFLGWRFYDANTTLLPKAGGTYSEALVGSAQFLNPILHQNNDVDRDFVSLVFSGLLRYDDQRALVPDLAERYELSSDQLTYTFYLRNNVTWHDGDAFTADDVVFTFQKMQDQKVKSPLYASYKDIYVQKIDDLTVQFGLKKPFAPFLDLMTRQIIPEHIWKTIPSDNFYLAQLNLKPVGTGPWKYKSFKKNADGTIRSYTFERNETYYSAKPYLEKLTFKFYPDNDAAIQALKNKNVQGVSFVPRDLRDRLTKNTDLNYYTFDAPQYTALFFNQSLNADLKSKAVRQALAYAIDKDRLVREVLAGEGHTVQAPLLPGFLGYHEKVRRYDTNQATAQQLLETAGWKKDSEGRLIKERSASSKDKGSESEPEQLKVSLVTVHSPEHTKAAELIRQDWQRLGAQVETTFVDATRMKSEVIDGRNFEVLLYGEIIGSDPDLYPFWHSSQAQAPGLNLALFSNATADKLLEDGRQTADPQKRAEMYQKFQDVLAEEVPAIFLYSPTYNYAVANDIQGITDRRQIVYPSDRFGTVQMWYTKTRREWNK
jgi:peptide/nickel transport system substrate-binding protein